MAFTRRSFLTAAAGAAASSLALGSARASGTPWVIGQTTAFTGPPAGTVRELTHGAKIYLAQTNALGGVNGRPIKLLQLDDGFKPKRAADNASELIKSGVSALFLTRGTPTNEAIIQAIKPSGIPLIAPSTGAMSLRDPLIRNVFNVRSSYRTEGERVVHELATLTHERIGVIVVDDSFGRDVMDGVMPGFKRAGIKPVFVFKFDREKKDFADLVQEASRINAQSVLIIAATDPTVKMITGMRQAKCTSMAVTMSTNASNQFVQQLGDAATGVGVVQVFPKPRSFALPLILEASKALERHTPAIAGNDKQFSTLTPAMLEGFVSAKVLVEGLRRSEGERPGQLIEAFESIKDFDTGWREISYSRNDHNGLNYAELSVINQKGRFIF